MTRFLCSKAFCKRLDSLSLICTFFDLSLFLHLFPFSTSWCLLYYLTQMKPIFFHQPAHFPPPRRQNDKMLFMRVPLVATSNSPILNFFLKIGLWPARNVIGDVDRSERFGTRRLAHSYSFPLPPPHPPRPLGNHNAERRFWRSRRRHS